MDTSGSYVVSSKSTAFEFQLCLLSDIEFGQTIQPNSVPLSESAKLEIFSLHFSRRL
jgi:hypothetical protein